MACQESSNSGSKNNYFATGTSAEVFDEDDVAIEGSKRSIFVHGSQNRMNAQGGMATSSTIQPAIRTVRTFIPYEEEKKK